VVEVQPSRRRVSRVAIVLAISSALLGIVAGVRITLVTGANGDGPPATVPGTITVPVDDPGMYAIFVRTGTDISGPGFSFNANLGSRLDPDDVRVTGPGGKPLAVMPVSGTETITRNQVIYTATAEFRADTAGDHTVEIGGPSADRSVIVNRELADQIKSLVPWLLVMVLTGFVLCGSLIALVVSLVRKNRVGRPDRPVSGTA
jgi:hypothetical protein